MNTLRTYINIIENLNEEVRWQGSLFNYLFTSLESGEELIDADSGVYYAPIVSSMMTRLQTTTNMRALHALGPENLINLINAQNKKSKQISAFTIDSEQSLTSSGVWAGAGLVALVQGDAHVGMAADMESRVDKKGMRLINIGPASDMSGTIDFDFYDSPEYNDMYSDLLVVRSEILSSLQDYIQQKGIELSNIPGDVKARAIKQLIDGIEPVIAKHQKTFDYLFVSHMKNQSQGYDGYTDDYDEIVIGNFKIKKLFVVSGEYSAINDEMYQKYFPKDGVFCQEENRCINIDFPVEEIDFEEIEHSELLTQN